MSRHEGSAQRQDSDWETLYWWRRGAPASGDAVSPSVLAERLHGLATRRPAPARARTIPVHQLPANDRYRRDPNPLGTLQRERRSAALSCLICAVAAVAFAALVVGAAPALGRISLSVAPFGVAAAALGLVSTGRRLRAVQARLRLLRLVRTKALCPSPSAACARTGEGLSLAQ